MATKKKQHKAIQKLSDLTPDDANLNDGTERGRYMLSKSLEMNGAGRSILVDKEGKVIAGNKTLEVAADIGIDEIIVVPSDGKKLVVVQRTDLSMDDPDDKRARVLAYADNRVAQIDLAWDAEKLLQLSSEVSLTEYVNPDELKRFFDKAGVSISDDVEDVEFPEFTKDIAKNVQMITCPHCKKEFPK